MAKKYNLVNKTVGKLKVISLVPKDERPTQNHGNYWLCKCECGNYIKVPTTYLTGNSNYTQLSCGCERKQRAFQASTKIQTSDQFLNQYKDDFEKFLFIHHSIMSTSGNDSTYYKDHQLEYEEIINFFWNDKQFNSLYSLWLKNKNQNNTFYDWLKPSLDHIIPSSKGGKNELCNFQFLTTFENLAKRDMTMEEWNLFKINTNTKSDYFIENIMKERVG